MGIEFGPRGIASGPRRLRPRFSRGASPARIGQTVAPTRRRAADRNGERHRAAQLARQADRENSQNTPQSINVVPLEVMQQQGVATLQDALKNVPGITLNAGEGGTHGDLVNLRGFSAGDDYLPRRPARHRPLRPRRLRLRIASKSQRPGLDLVRPRLDRRRHQPGAEDAAALSDRRTSASPAARTTKRAAPPTSTMCSATRSALRVNVDGPDQRRRRPPLRRATSAGASRRRSPSASARDTTFSLKYLHQQEDNMPDYGIPFLFGKPAPVRARHFLRPAGRRPLQDQRRCR